MNSSEFKEMLNRLAECWRTKDYLAAAEFFTADVKYADPRRYSFSNYRELLSFFETDDGYPQRIEWHTIVFDEPTQTGAAEYTYVGTESYHGVTIIHLTNRKISHWREYQHVDTREWKEFAGTTVF